MVCPGYLAAWACDLYGFRRRTLVERVFWSVPLSLGIATIASDLVGRFASIAVAAALAVLCAAVWVATLAREWVRRREGKKLAIGWRPMGNAAALWAVAWAVFAVLSVVDFESGHRLYMSIGVQDQAARINWTESILHTGVPPANPGYWFHGAAPMRNYYFWYVLCAVTARWTGLGARAVFNASTVWAGFALAALAGLYLRHFLRVGDRLRVQFLRVALLFTVTGVGICLAVWQIAHAPPQEGYIPGAWMPGHISSWPDSLLWAPHHVSSMVCCMLAFLLAWMGGSAAKKDRAWSVLLAACALASAFGLSVYVSFTFFVLMVMWGIWRLAVEKRGAAVGLLALAGAGAAVLLVPYVWELLNGTSAVAGGSVLAFAVRTTIPPEGLLRTGLFAALAAAHPVLARNLANLVLLLPGYAIELGFYLAVLAIFAVPRWRGRVRLTEAQRTLVFLVVASLPVVSFIRSSVIATNDFAWRSVLVPQFALLLLGSEVLVGWNVDDPKHALKFEVTGLPRRTPYWLRSVTALALVLGMLGVGYQALIWRFLIPLVSANARVSQSGEAGDVAENAYLSHVGYAALDKAIPPDAIVQYNPASASYAWSEADWLGVDHQIAIASDQLFCGAELGGDPAGCRVMAPAMDELYRGETAAEARATCGEFGIDYLIARATDAAWKDRQSWVWTLPAVVAQKEFRAVKCE